MPITIIKVTPRKWLAESVKRSRKSAGLSQEDVAAKLKRPQSYVSKVEAGTLRLEVADFVRFCRAINTNPVAVIQALADRFFPKRKG